MKQFFFLVLSFFLISPIFTNAQTYSEVWFENSHMPVRYSNSEVSYSGDSWIKNIKQQIPISDSVFLTPKNALEISYTSGEMGHWSADINYPLATGLKIKDEYSLHFKLFIQSETSVKELPAIELIQFRDRGVEDSLNHTIVSPLISLGQFIKKIDYNKWISVEIPLRKLDLSILENRIETIRFLQNSFDGKEHTLFIDQIEFLPAAFPQSQLTSAAVLSSATGYERHIDLTWKLPLTPSIRYIKFYRSIDNENFEPIAIRPTFAKKYSDVVSGTDTAYYYKISWVDYYYRESPFSNVLKVKTNKLDSEGLMTMIQKASASYFTDGEEFNSGMQLKDIYNQNSIVSIKSTGVGILALIASIKENFQLREAVLKRIIKVVSFLETAEKAHGVFPELLDGRTGKAVYNDNIATKDSVNLVVDLESTSILIQALLVSKQYFNQNNDIETELRNKISMLWRSVEWNEMLDSEGYLSSKWSLENGEHEGHPLSGISKMYLYIMALASPENNIELDSYSKALTKPLKLNDPKISHLDSLLIEEEPDELSLIIDTKRKDYHEVPFINGHTYYGVPLVVGSKEDNLFDILMGFIALDISDVRDDYANYYENTQKLIKVQHRQSLEQREDKLYISNGIAIYPYNKKLATEKTKEYYLKHAETLWTEYGFIRSIDFNLNRVVYPKEGLENGLNAVMIDNARSGFIWKLFMQDPDISKIVSALFKK